ncbi:hypothetical protein FB451DRAFT_1390978 [Mycena latifolia]|nr:hypothetical protein FB451DRAFT_1390978 [Mycena latifolia]
MYPPASLHLHLHSPFPALSIVPVMRRFILGHMPLLLHILGRCSICICTFPAPPPPPCIARLPPLTPPSLLPHPHPHAPYSFAPSLADPRPVPIPAEAEGARMPGQLAEQSEDKDEDEDEEDVEQEQEYTPLYKDLARQRRQHQQQHTSTARRPMAGSPLRRGVHDPACPLRARCACDACTRLGRRALRNLGAETEHAAGGAPRYSLCGVCARKVAPAPAPPACTRGRRRLGRRTSRTLPGSAFMTLQAPRVPAAGGVLRYSLGGAASCLRHLPASRTRSAARSRSGGGARWGARCTENDEEQETETARETGKEKEKMGAPKGRMLHARAREREVPVEEEPQSEPVSSARAERRTRAREARALGGITAEPDETDVDVPAKPARHSRSRKPTTEHKSEHETSTDPAPTHRSRSCKSAAKLELEADDAPAALPTVPAVPAKPQRGCWGTAEPAAAPAVPPERKTGVKPVKEEEAEPVLQARAGRAKMATATPALSVPAAPKARATRKGAAPAAVEVGEGEYAGRGARGGGGPAVKVRVSRSRKVKEEDAEPVFEAPAPAPACAGQAKKAVAPPALPVPAPKARATRKGVVPSLVPAAVEVGAKENTPGEEREEGPAVKVRMLWSWKVKEENAEPVFEAPVPTHAGQAKKAAARAVPAAPKAHATRKGVALAVVEVGEKENTPGEEREEGPAVKVRVSRSRKLKGEVVESEANAMVPRRART